MEMRPDAPDRADGRVMAEEARDRLERAVGELPGKQRLAFIMRKMHELEYTEIGASLSCSEESARAHVFQALRKVRRSLDGHLPLGMESRS
jgi:RNA polymerase sigma factor (sigma-70 family)